MPPKNFGWTIADYVILPPKIQKVPAKIMGRASSSETIHVVVQSCPAKVYLRFIFRCIFTMSRRYPQYCRQVAA